MKIWVDADACPVVVKEILYRAAKRKKINLILVANQPLAKSHLPFVTTVVVPGGFDVADNYIIERVVAADLVITADIPLANAIVSKNALALNPRGTLYTPQNIKERLAIRDLSEFLRSSGQRTGGPSKISKTELQKFA